MMNPQIMSSTNPRQEEAGDSTATTIAMIELKLRTIITDMAESNGYDTAPVVTTLERLGLSTAITFVKPLVGILSRPADSPLRTLTVFQMQALYCRKDGEQRNVLDELERDMKSGHRTAASVTSGIVQVLNAQIAARVQLAKDRESKVAAYSKADYMRENLALTEKIAVYEQALEQAARLAGSEVNSYVANLLTSSDD